MDTNAAVKIVGAHKSYGSKPVLNGLNMTVKQGYIYGLLGASGCGKTTLLSCIVGRKTLNSGEICVLGGTPGARGSGVPGPRVGYMPQDIALIAEFTVKDAIYYFGRILEVKDNVIEERYRLFSDLLELPPGNRFIKNCSGGQKRRVSFAAAMVNMPELLILDEPTVGVDPVLRASIWEYLVEITAKHKMSVIITTHYIEEARQAHTIGLMRGGKLLAEESPARLLAVFETDSLEEVFLILSKQQEEGRLSELTSSETNQNDTVINQSNEISLITPNGSSNNNKNKKNKGSVSNSMALLKSNRMRALMDKNWKQFYRNVAGIGFLLIFPLVETCLFLSAIGNDISDIPLAIVNDENWMDSCSRFNTNETAVPFGGDDCRLKLLSCRFLTYLDVPMIRKEFYTSTEAARRSVTSGKSVGLMYISENFTEALEKRINEGRFADVADVTHSEIQVWMDMSNRQIGATIKYKLIELYLDFQKDVLKDCAYLEKMANIPIRFEDDIFGSRDEPYVIFMYPGALLTIIFFMGCLMTSQIIITDRYEGIWDRSAVAGVTALEITVAHFILQASVIFVESLEILVTVYGMYHYEYMGSLWALGIIIYIQGLAGMVYGFWVSVISTNHSMANIVACGSFYPMILLCGMMWPIEGMPTAVQWLAKCMPFTVATQSYRNVVSKGWPLSHIEVWNGVAIGLAWIIIFGFISVYLIKKKQ